MYIYIGTMYVYWYNVCILVQFMYFGRLIKAIPLSEYM